MVGCNSQQTPTKEKSEKSIKEKSPLQVVLDGYSKTRIKDTSLLRFQLDTYLDPYDEGVDTSDDIGYRTKYGFVDKTGKIVIPPQFDEVWSFSEGLCGVRIDKKYGFIDKTGNIVISCQFDDVSPNGFVEGLCGVKIGETFIEKRGMTIYNPGGEKWGFIDKTGKIVITPQFDEVGFFREGFCSVMIGHKSFIIDKTGKIVSD